MEQPEMVSIRYTRASNSRITPICARPRAPPEPSPSALRSPWGMGLSACASWLCWDTGSPAFDGSRIDEFYIVHVGHYKCAFNRQKGGDLTLTHVLARFYKRGHRR